MLVSWTLLQRHQHHMEFVNMTALDPNCLLDTCSQNTVLYSRYCYISTKAHNVLRATPAVAPHFLHCFALFCTFPIFLLDQIATVYATLSLFTSHPVPRVNTPTYYAFVMSTPFPYTPTQSPHHSDPYLFTSIGYWITAHYRARLSRSTNSRSSKSNTRIQFHMSMVCAIQECHLIKSYHQHLEILVSGQAKRSTFAKKRNHVYRFKK